MAIGVMRGAAERGLRLPDDLTVVGYDGVPLGAFLSPSLTTVAQDMHGLALTALDALPLAALASVNGRDTAQHANDAASKAAPVAGPANPAVSPAGGTGRTLAAAEAQTATADTHIVVHAQLVVRESCGCAADQSTA